MGKPRLPESTQTITSYIRRLVYYGSNRQQEVQTLNVLVMETKQHSLLFLKACVDLNLITVKDSVYMVADELLENILAEYDSVFKGIGCLPGKHDLEIDESITPEQVRVDTLTKQCTIVQVESPTP